MTRGLADRSTRVALVGAIVIHAAIAFTMRAMRVPTPPLELPVSSASSSATIDLDLVAMRAIDPPMPIIGASPKLAPSLGIVAAAPNPSLVAVSTMSTTNASHVKLEGTTAEATTTVGVEPVAPPSRPHALDAWSAVGSGTKLWMPGKLGESFTLSKDASDPKNAEKQAAAKLDKDVASLSDKASSASSLYAGPAVSAAYDAARSPLAPDVGTAVFTVFADASGKVTSVSLGDVSGDFPGWTAIGKTIQSSLAGKTLDVPPKSKGVAITLKITAKYALPSGAQSFLSDPKVGGTVLGPTFSMKFDLSDIGQKKTRQVSVVVASESRLD